MKLIFDSTDDSTSTTSRFQTSNDNTQSLLARISSRCPSCDEEAIKKTVADENIPTDVENTNNNIKFENLTWSDGRIFSVNIANRHLMSPLPIDRALYLIQEIIDYLLPHLTSQDLVLTVLPVRSKNTDESNQLLPNTAERIGSIYAANELFSDTFNADVKPKDRLKLPYQLSFQDDTHSSKSIATFGYFGRIVFTSHDNINRTEQTEDTSDVSHSQSAETRRLLSDTVPPGTQQTSGVVIDKAQNDVESDNESSSSDASSHDEEETATISHPKGNTKPELQEYGETQRELLQLIALLADVMIVIDTNLEIDKKHQIILPPFIEQIKESKDSKNFNNTQIFLLAPNFETKQKQSVKSPLPNVHLFSQGMCCLYTVS